MSITLDAESFQRGHKAFLAHMREKSGGIRFTSFDHTFFVDDEVAYKLSAARDGRKALNLPKWDSWLQKPGRVLEATREACTPQVSHNLMEHRYGAEGNSYSPLYRVSTKADIAQLESELNGFFREGGAERAQFGKRFDGFAEYLRDNRLGCKWPFLAYLSFLLDSTRYFPILPGTFEELMSFYGADRKIAGRVEWHRYLAILDMADLVKEQLTQYGTPTAIEVQSYMWVVGNLVKNGPVDDLEIQYDHGRQEELIARQRRAGERERIGLLGEWYVYESERRKLKSAGLDSLANNVSLVSFIDESAGYDILSFNESGERIHIEVKTTQRERSSDHGFWLSQNEHSRALEDRSWTIYRVWAIDDSPHHENVGNIVTEESNAWELRPGSWFVASDPSDA